MVIVRGVAQSDIFYADDDREDFVNRLSLLLTETKTRCSAWALLDNHLHLLLMPTEHSLARFMRKLLTGYAVSFNLRHKRAGHLFQNRYKSIVCDDEAYLLELVRYIHLNPLRAGIISTLAELAEYRWSGHQQLLGDSDYQLIRSDELWQLFAKRKKAAVARYLQFVSDGLHQGKGVKLSHGGRQASQAFNHALMDDDLFDDRILGGGSFVEQILGQGPSKREVKLTLEGLITKVAIHCALDAEDLAWPCRQPSIVRAKAIICYLAMRRMPPRCRGGDKAGLLKLSSQPGGQPGRAVTQEGRKTGTSDSVSGFIKNVHYLFHDGT